MKLKNKLSKKLYQRVFHAIDIPEDLAAITSIDDEGAQAAVEAGLAPEIVEKIWECTQKVFKTGMHPALSICFRRHGKIVLNRSLGYVSGVGPDEPFVNPTVASVDTPICLFSASKFVSAILVHLLAEQGRINLLDPLSYYIPAFSANGKGSISIHQMLSHRSGVPYLPEGITIDDLVDRQRVLKMIYAAEPSDSDGRDMAYHAVTGGFLIDELIRVTTGMDAQQYLDRYIRKPMGMHNFRYGFDLADRDLVAKNYVTGLPSEKIVGGVLKKALGMNLTEAVHFTNDDRFLEAIVPSANLYATAEETSRFLQMLLDHGQWQGKKILDPLTVHRATREVGKMRIDKTLFLPMRYSAGAMLGANPVGFYGRNSHHAYGHIGLSNIFCWVDPERAISVAILNTGKPVLGPHLKSFLSLVDLISSSCPPVIDMLSDEPHYKRACE